VRVQPLALPFQQAQRGTEVEQEAGGQSERLALGGAQAQRVQELADPVRVARGVFLDEPDQVGREVMGAS